MDALRDWIAPILTRAPWTPRAIQVEKHPC